MPTFRLLWLRNRTAFAPELTAFVDDLIAKLAIAKPVDVAAEFKAGLASISGGDLTYEGTAC